MNRNINLDEKEKELANLKSEWKKMKEQEKQLKEKFYSSPFEARAKIKRELSQLQKKMLDRDWGCNRSASIDIKNEEMIQKLKNPTGPATDPHHLATLIKEELRATLDGRQKFEIGDTVGDIWEAKHSKEICYFGQNKEINELIANLARNRQKPLDPDKITTRLVRVKQEDFSTTDFNEMISLIHQVKNFLEEQEKQDQQKTKNIKLNNPHLFTQWRCSTDGEYNDRGVWESWHTFSGKRNGFNYTVYVPDNHIALTNCLFDNGWGTNSEMGKFFVVKGSAEPTELHYWNVAKQRDEIISEDQARQLTKKDKDYCINYRTYVNLDDKITIDHYQENGQQELIKPVSGANKLVENNGRKNMSGGSYHQSRRKRNQQLDNEFLLKYFQEHDIKQISLTPKGGLWVEYNSGKSEIKTSGQNNDQELQRITSYFQESGRNKFLSRNDLINMTNTNSLPTKTPNNVMLISCGIGLILIIGLGIGLIVRKKKNKCE